MRRQRNSGCMEPYRSNYASGMYEPKRWSFKDFDTKEEDKDWKYEKIRRKAEMRK